MITTAPRALRAGTRAPSTGFGAPLANPQPFRPEIGTHGMFCTALFGQGIPGALRDDHLPAALPIMLICAGVVLRDRRVNEERRRDAITNSSIAVT
ncbi:MAG: hypothetical protein ACI81L_000968 [Verrucomicrobiales bacterium]|jgi:hypothetical protein